MSKPEHAPTQINRERLVGWLFFMGSLLFVVDSLLANLNHISVSSLLQLVASILFTLGSILLIPKDA